VPTDFPKFVKHWVLQRDTNFGKSALGE